MNAAKRLSVHLIGWDEADFREMWPSLARQTWKDWHGVVVEEGGQMVVEHCADAQDAPVVLRNASHLGPAKAQNQAIAFALSRWEPETFHERFILVLHAGVWLEDQTLEMLLRAFSTDPSLMIACPKTMRAVRVWSEQDEEWKREPTNIVEQAGWILTRGRRWAACGNGGPDTGEWDANRDIFSVGDGCVMIRASVFSLLDIGTGEWLDPDVRDGQVWRDFCWQSQRMGCRIQCIGSARIWRLATYPEKDRSLVRRVRNWYGSGAFRIRLRDEEQSVMRWKNDAFFVRLPHLSWIWLERLRRIGISLLDPRLFVAFLCAWKKRLRAWGKHRAISKRQKRSPTEMRSTFL